MRKTAFVCLGDEGKKDTLVYHELPRKESGEELFVFMSLQNHEHDDIMRNLYREAISISRLGHPTHYFARFIEALKSVGGGIGAEALMPPGSITMIMIRRDREVYLLLGTDVEPVLWDGEHGVEMPFSPLSGVKELPLKEEGGQADLFTTTVEDHFALYRFNVPDGNRTLLIAPDKEFRERYRETLRNSIFFPGFELPAAGQLGIATSRTIPALHWHFGLERESAPARPGHPRLKRISVPAIVGVLTLAVAVFLVFGPFRAGRNGNDIPEENVLLSANDVDSEDERVSDTPEIEPAAESAATAEGALSLDVVWKETFDKPVTSSPLFGSGLIFFGCRDGSMYAFEPSGAQRWKYASGQGIGASPYFVDGLVVGANYAGDVFCLDVSAGERMWSTSVRTKVVSSPRGNGDMVVVGTMEGRLVALSLKDGASIWSQKLGRAIWATPTVGDDYIVVTTTDGSLIKLNHEGKISWRVKPGGEINSSPLVIEDRDIIVFGSQDKFVYAYSLSNGDLMWRFVTGGEVNGSGAAEGDDLYIGSQDGYLYALSINGVLKWRRAVGGAVLSKPLVTDDQVFVTNYGSKLVAVDRETGEVAGEFRAGSPIYSSPSHDGDRIFFGSNGGVFYVLNLY
jgi:outer membrane protein assembly factor BamB